MMIGIGMPSSQSKIPRPMGTSCYSPGIQPAAQKLVALESEKRSFDWASGCFLNFSSFCLRKRNTRVI